MALRALTVDLPADQAREQLPTDVERDYLGGRGAIAWLLYHRLPPDTPPLAAENLLVFAAGPLAGTAALAGNGFVIGTRSPITGAIGYSWGYGQWGAALRQSGTDLLVIRGQASEWSYLLIDQEGARVHSAAHLLGLDTKATTAALIAAHGPGSRVLCLGQAGEAEVAYCSIVAEGRYIAEPAGTGSVMANKRLKAIVVRSGQQLPVVEPAKLHVANTIIQRRVEGSPLAASIRKIGSAHLLARAAAWGGLSERDGKEGKLSEALARLVAALPLLGRHLDKGIDEGLVPFYLDFVRPNGERLPFPDLETVAAFARCGITSPNFLITIADQCLRLGLDTAATSASIAFLMECQEEGLAQQQTLPYGNEEAVLNAINSLGVKRERRDVLSLGVGEIFDIFWGGEAFAPQVKGLAMPGLEPRGLNEVALAMATAPIGGDYRYAMTYEELIDEPPSWLPDEAMSPHESKGKAIRLIWHERFAAVLDAAGICRRLGLMAYQVSPAEMLAMVIAATGHNYSGADITRLGERIVTVERLFARSQGDNGGVDGLPERYTSTPLEGGKAAGKLPPLAELLAEYYGRHGWTGQGDPTPERLADLGIKF
jgi:aldehyde:ferredoxin oxidoreductase